MFGFYLNMKIHLFGYYHLRLFSFIFSVIFICLFVFICSDFPFFVCLLFSVVRLFSIVKIFSVVQSFAVFVISCHFQVFGYFYFFQLFGYFQSAAEEHEEAAGVGEEVSIFTVSKRRRVGEAAGEFSFYGPRFAIIPVF